MLRDHLHMLWPDLEVLAEASDGPSALVEIETRRPDVAFLDIRMPGLTGLEVARAATVQSRIVFVTAYDTHAVEAFEASALDYILKPVDTARLAAAVAKLRKSVEVAASLSVHQLTEALARLGVRAPGAVSFPFATEAVTSRLEWLQVAVGQRVHMVHVNDVCYFESDTKYTRVVSDFAEGLIRLSLKELLGRFDDQQFLQTHRSAVVNRRFIRAVHRDGESMEIELRGRPERIKVSTANHHLFKAM